MTEEKKIKSLDQLLNWIERNGYAGWDPYDIKGKKWVIGLADRGRHSFFFRYLRETVYEFFYRFPLSSRKALKIKPAINPKAMGLFASAYLQLYQVSGKKKHLLSSHECLDWLIGNASGQGPGMGWGYPFDWQSDKLIPAHTPNGIVTTAAGDAFWRFYKHYGDKKYLDYCERIAQFLSSLPVDRMDGDKLCFSYTPAQKNHVHNLNLFVAEFLIKTGMELKNQRWTEMGNQAVNYTLNDQLENGSFDYNGPPEKPLRFIDHYHTGFVLRMLYSIWEFTGREDVYSATEKCLQHYVGNFFEDGTIPKLLPHRKYRIDIHSCAESIICLSELSGTWPQYLPIAHRVLNWTIDNLQDPSGYFHYGYLKSRFTGRIYRSRIPYIRWGQAWMLKAFSTIPAHSS
jgi:rhamnogalacturonyl hydrolase YesR